MRIFAVKTFANYPKTAKFKGFTRERFPLYGTLYSDRKNSVGMKAQRAVLTAVALRALVSLVLHVLPPPLHQKLRPLPQDFLQRALQMTDLGGLGEEREMG